jgi:hypothetical protein
MHNERNFNFLISLTFMIRFDLMPVDYYNYIVRKVNNYRVATCSEP